MFLPLKMNQRHIQAFSYPHEIAVGSHQSCVLIGFAKKNGASLDDAAKLIVAELIVLVVDGHSGTFSGS